VRIKEDSIVLDDWAREPLSFYFLPPTEADLEALADEAALRLSSALEGAVRTR
jgi:hypothetical protein